MVPPSTPLALRPPRRRMATALTVVVNGRASGAPGCEALDALTRELRVCGCEVDVVRTASVEELAALWRRDDGRRLVLVGGDGSVHAAANLPGPARDIALVPAGRANNIARSLGIPRDPAAAARLAATGEVRPLDLIEATTPQRRRVVVEGVSAGFLAQARTGYHGRNSGDLRAALRTGAATLARFHAFDATITTSRGVEHEPLAQLFVANLPLYAFGLHVAPRADPTDATLDLVGLEARSRAGVVRMLVALRRGTADHRSGVHRWRAARITIDTDGCSPIVGDSEDLGIGPVSLTVLPLALRLVRP